MQNRIEKALRKRNQRKQAIVQIRSIVANQEPLSLRNPFGEFNADQITHRQVDLETAAQETDIAVLERSLETIQTLAIRAAERHISDNYLPEPNKEYLLPHLLAEKAFKNAAKNSLGPPSLEAIQLEKNHLLGEQLQMDPKKQNHVTIVSTPEFYFYPLNERGPLSLDAMRKYFLPQLTKLAEGYPPNLHLLLATFPVSIDYSTYKNIAVYVQCGSYPVLHVFCKALSSEQDAIYSNQMPVSLADLPPQDFPNNFRPLMIAAQNNRGHIMPTAGHVIAITHGGAQFRVSIDICIDHKYKATKKLTYQNILIADPASELLTEHTLHIVTSNTIPLYDEAALTKWIVHADYRASKSKQSLTSLSHYLKPEYTLRIQEPPFGISNTLYFYPVLPMEKNKEFLANQIEAHNNLVFELQPLHQIREQHPKELHAIDLKINECIINWFLKQLTSPKPLLIKKEFDLLKEQLELAMSNRKSLMIILNTLGKQIPKSLTTKKQKFLQQLIENMVKQFKIEIKISKRLKLQYAHFIKKKNVTSSSQSPSPKDSSGSISVASLAADAEEETAETQKLAPLWVDTPAETDPEKLQTSSSSRSSSFLHLLPWVLSQGYHRFFAPAKVALSPVTGSKSVEADSLPHGKSSLPIKVVQPRIVSSSQVSDTLTDLASSSHGLDRLAQHVSSFHEKRSTFMRDFSSQLPMRDTIMDDIKLEAQSEPAAEFQRKTPSSSLFLTPLSWSEHIVVAKYLLQFSTFSFSWNKEKDLLANDIEILQQDLIKLTQLQKSFEVKKTKRAFRFGVNNGQFADVELLLKNTKDEIQQMLDRGRKTDAQFSAQQNNMQRMEKMINQLTNKKIEKSLRRVEIQLEREQRRRPSFTA